MTADDTETQRVEAAHRSPTADEWVFLDVLRSHHFNAGGGTSRPGDPGWSSCQCGAEMYWTDWQPHIATLMASAARDADLSAEVLIAERDQLRAELARRDEVVADACRVLSDLDRCEHGRHEGDVCGGCGGGPSHGNLNMTRDRVIGHDISGRPYIVPAFGSTQDPNAWDTRAALPPADADAGGRLANAWDEGALWAAVECGVIENESVPWLAADDNPYRADTGEDA